MVWVDGEPKFLGLKRKMGADDGGREMMALYYLKIFVFFFSFSRCSEVERF